MPCEEVLSDFCENRHRLQWKCQGTRPQVCEACDKEAKAAEKQRKKEFALREKREKEEREYAAKLAKIEADLERQREEIRDAQLGEERERALQQKQKDLRDAEELALLARSREAKSKSEPPQRPPTVSPGAPTMNSGPSPLPTSSSPPKSSRSTPAPNPPKAPLEPVVPPSNQVSTPPSSPPTDSSNTAPAKPASPPPKPVLPKATPVAVTGFPASNRKRAEAEEQWEYQKTIQGARSAAIDAIMEMTGLDTVKSQVLGIKELIDTAKRQGIDPGKSRYNLTLLGNPGTGEESFRYNSPHMSNADVSHRQNHCSSSSCYLLRIRADRSRQPFRRDNRITPCKRRRQRRKEGTARHA